MSKKTQVAKIILSMTRADVVAMANDLVDMQSNAKDDGPGWNLESSLEFAHMLRTWARGLGSIE
jgi:hypothetical protein